MSQCQGLPEPNDAARTVKDAPPSPPECGVFTGRGCCSFSFLTYSLHWGCVSHYNDRSAGISKLPLPRLLLRIEYLMVETDRWLSQRNPFP